MTDKDLEPLLDFVLKAVEKAVTPLAKKQRALEERIAELETHAEERGRAA